MEIDNPTEEQILAAEALARETVDDYTEEHVLAIIRHALGLNERYPGEREAQDAVSRGVWSET